MIHFLIGEGIYKFKIQGQPKHNKKSRKIMDLTGSKKVVGNEGFEPPTPSV